MRYPEASDAAVSRRMRQTGRRDTSAERAVRSLVHARGLRYRVDARPDVELRTRADLVFTRARVAVFIDGCFWHGCPDHFTLPLSNRQWWSDKIEANRARDRRAAMALEARGWLVLRFWEHEAPEAVADRIERAVRGS
jgi:DNA mismatch endonuclease, patch repair protein